MVLWLELVPCLRCLYKDSGYRDGKSSNHSIVTENYFLAVVITALLPLTVYIATIAVVRDKALS